MNRAKLLLSRACELTKISSLFLRAQAAMFSKHIRAVNYHDVPPSLARGFEAQLQFFREHFVPVTLADLEQLSAGSWPHEKPGILLSFDDGLRSQAQVCAPLLERYGMCGWFMIPSAFVDAREQAAFARRHRIMASDEYQDGRIAMSWDDVHRLDGKHVIGCHSKHHRRLSAHLGASGLDEEIGEAKRELETRLGHPVEVFAWVGGEEGAYSREAALRIRAAGFRYSFMTNHALFRPGDDTLQIQRSNIEAHFPLHLVRFHLSGIMDLLYAQKRRRVNRLTA
jgi:peptidoglycan/xylan/chitin deacetylase (PgdA/CDA1 family)